MAVLGLRFCARAFSSCGKAGATLHRGARATPLTIAASLVAEHRLQMRRLSNCGSRAQLLRGIPPRPGLEPVSLALAGRFSTTAPPGKPGATLCCSAWASHCSGFSCCGARALECRLSSCGART